MRRAEVWVLAAVLATVPQVAGARGGDEAEGKVEVEDAEGGGGAQAEKPVTAESLEPLSWVKTPRVKGLGRFVRNKQAAIALGKVLFWDMQVGGDGIQSCASCHFNAGVDNRAINQLTPGLARVRREGDFLVADPDTTFQVGPPNHHLRLADFPFHDPSPDCRDSLDPACDKNDATSSQGVHASSFLGIDPESSVDLHDPILDGIFELEGIGLRKVEPRNTPTMINAVFHFRNFWDGRAQNDCNLINPFGKRDQDPKNHLLEVSRRGSLKAVKPTIPNSSLCSQALGPPLSPFEMSGAGRDFRFLGKKLLAASPLGSTRLPGITALAMQEVAPDDSVLGDRSRGWRRRGLLDSYANMVERAFQPRWWDSPLRICVADDGTESIIDPDSVTCPPETREYTLAEYNFSMFWGIAIQMYESTLRADDTPFDRYLAELNGPPRVKLVGRGDGRRQKFEKRLHGPIHPGSVKVYVGWHQAVDDGLGNLAGDGITGTIDYASGRIELRTDRPPRRHGWIYATWKPRPRSLTEQQEKGLEVFLGKGKCINCHGGSELTNASVRNVRNEKLERMVMGDGGVAVYDNGFYNIATRPSTDDPGVGGVDPWGRPLSMSGLGQELVCADPSRRIRVSAEPGVPEGRLRCDERIAVFGAMKTPGLRNVELTAPYFHHGGAATLEQVVEFYDRGGDFPGLNRQDLDPDIQRLGLTDEEEQALVAFLKALTDERVRNHAAPFDHPELVIPNGHPTPLVADSEGQAIDQWLHIPAVGRRGYGTLPDPLRPFEEQLAP